MKSASVTLYLMTLLFSCTAIAAVDDYYNGKGGLLYSHFLVGGYDSVVKKANQHCASIGKGQPTINRKSNGCLLFCGSEYHEYEFVCAEVSSTKIDEFQRPLSIQEPAESLKPATIEEVAKMTINDAKKQCDELGFKRNTEKYGECVLELTK
jgi:hypothetical protein